MKDRNILRLRLVVRRHALPEVRVVFPIRLDTEPTIANLLEQINEVIPLESNDWGLEDYAVELRDSNGSGFECLHFQHVSVTLNDDEEVHIRPLDTGDRRKRRLSGRYQISRDGKRLIDGIAFGRPRLKAPRDRPAVDIPPLKRPRIAYDADEEQYQEDEEAPRLLLTEHGESPRGGSRVRKRVRFNNYGGSHLDEDYYDDEEEEDDDFDDGDHADKSDGDSDTEDEPNDSEIEDELQALRAENGQTNYEIEDELQGLQADNERSQPESSAQIPALDLQTIDKISALRLAFPTAEVAACERALATHDGDVKSAYYALQSKHRTSTTLGTVLAYVAPSPSRDGNDIVPRVLDDDEASDAESVATVVKHYDQHGFPSGSILDGTASTQVVEAMRKSGLPVKRPVHTKFDNNTNTEAAGASQQSPGQETDKSMIDSPPSDDSGSDTHTDNDGSDESYESDESDDSDDSGPEVASSKLPITPASLKLPSSKQPTSIGIDESAVESTSDSDSSSLVGESDGDESSDDEDNSSGSHESESSDDDSDSDSSVSSGSGVDASTGVQDDTDSDSSADTSGSDSESEDGEDGSDSSSSDDSSEAEADADTKSSSVQNEAQASHVVQSTPPIAPGTANNVRMPVPPGQGKTATQKRNARRRAALQAKKAAAAQEATMQLQDSKNLVADKKAELLLRLNLVPSVSPEDTTVTNNIEVKFHKGSPETQPQPAEETQHVQSDPDAWRDKILYRAVECVESGVELSEPPFPFVQRWDPQQKRRGGRSKRKQRDQDQYLDDSSWSSAKRHRHGTSLGDHDAYEASYSGHHDAGALDESALNYDDEVPMDEEHSKQPGLQGVGEDDDMPALPEDVSSLPIFEPDKAVPGMILTWKQLLLSKSTNWQPQVWQLTGEIISVLDDNTLKLRLAKRDWNRDRNEKVYDEDGNRVYDKFELPAMDEEGEDGEEDGFRTLDLADMMESRILRGSSRHTSMDQPKHPSVLASPDATVGRPRQRPGSALHDETVASELARSNQPREAAGDPSNGTQGAEQSKTTSETLAAAPKIAGAQNC
ncbi:hypothetical protein VTJ83DRAFT_4094 [Remersonia thermophila]|uniref:DUF7357 domain-containing protein n=1 Tax=Remersonia thermophila TaxID=72144 RepID=A0ABR4DFV4_9PEZI